MDRLFTFIFSLSSNFLILDYFILFLRYIYWVIMYSKCLQFQSEKLRFLIESQMNFLLIYFVQRALLMINFFISCCHDFWQISLSITVISLNYICNFFFFNFATIICHHANIDIRKERLFYSMYNITVYIIVIHFHFTNFLYFIRTKY